MHPPGLSASVDSALPGASTLGAENSTLDSALIERSLAAEPLSRWMGWRLRLLVVAALIGCLATLLLARALGDIPQVDVGWRASGKGQLELASSALPVLKPHEGEAVVAMVAADGTRIKLDDLALRRASRWLVDDNQRNAHIAMQQAMASALQQGKVSLLFADGSSAEVPAEPRGIRALSPMFWLLCGLALIVYLVAMVVMLARPTLRNLLFALAALCQAGNLALIAIESSMSLGLPLPMPHWNLPAHATLDLLAGAALVHAAALHPRRLPAAGVIGWLVWLGTAAVSWALNHGALAAAWWWVQGSVALLGMGAIVLLSWSHMLEPHPFAIVTRRFATLATAAWLALTLAIAWSANHPLLQQQIAIVGPTLWSVLLGSLLVLLPFLSKSQQVMREFSLLAAISTIATALDLLFVAAFSLGQFASLTLALFLSLGLYSGARQWLLNQLSNQNVITTERMFEKLYRIAREVEAHPERTSSLLTQLLRDLFQPMEAGVIDKRYPTPRVAGAGSTLLIPVPELPHGDATEHGTIVIRFAHHGRRLFTSEDARLAERVVEQLRRAVAFDQAVEQGRNEERLRIAQDLHDDIGARLLTLMYKAQSPEMEDYVRHTLQDLKTLTRGLAAPSHPLSHAAAEWKADLTQRLAAAHITLGWSFSTDRDISLSVVQWSALTRVMRELVSNVISHSQARRVDVEFSLENDRLDLSVCDNGVGRNPKAWSHGLGLGGVRKRVKQLGGEVEWREVPTGGICCRVCVRQLSERAEPSAK
ncbi:ATP-binding protein [Piscinibacter sp. HJYY11]|uniref:sensor histidine kinase n=1 Tax=Piscinibacter sp. HJYY11 TaxID=2801333 RepID=UPI00191F6CD8|nr:ATP-binding protein [Piscinibacter sp. HJYY11]MBL0731084.1 histidine kinase [Piscinibacter sp. HJYY11]